MIRYDLKCDRGHGFDSWFSSTSAYDSLSRAGQIDCPECGSVKVDKALMAPKIGSRRALPATEADPAKPDPRAAAIAALRAKIEAESTYVGPRFASEARQMHEGGAPFRAVHGEATLGEAKRLIEDGVPIAPLPFVPKSKVN